MRSDSPFFLLLQDTDKYVKAAEGTQQRHGQQLRFKAGDSVLANIRGEYKAAVISRVNDVVGGTTHAYRIRLADGSGAEAIAPQDTDEFVRNITASRN